MFSFAHHVFHFSGQSPIVYGGVGGEIPLTTITD